MNTPSDSDSDDSIRLNLINWIIDAGINGFGVLPSAEQVAENHKKSSDNIEDAVNSVIAWRTAHAAGTGFITGLGGVAMLPIAIPASMISSFALGANTAAAVAKLRGYDIQSDQVRTMIVLCLIGESVEAILRTAGIQVGKKSLKVLISQVPGKVLIEINKKVGFRLITKAGEKGVVNLT